MSNKGLFRTILERMIEGRQRKVDAYVANYVASHPELRSAKTTRRG